MSSYSACEAVRDQLMLVVYLVIRNVLKLTWFMVRSAIFKHPSPASCMLAVCALGMLCLKGYVNTKSICLLLLFCLWSNCRLHDHACAWLEFNKVCIDNVSLLNLVSSLSGSVFLLPASNPVFCFERLLCTFVWLLLYACLFLTSISS